MSDGLADELFTLVFLSESLTNNVGYSGGGIVMCHQGNGYLTGIAFEHHFYSKNEHFPLTQERWICFNPLSLLMSICKLLCPALEKL